MNLTEEQLEKGLRESDTFQDFWAKNEILLIEYAEKSTGELIDGLEPLLTIEAVKNMAQDLWEEENN